MLMHGSHGHGLQLQTEPSVHDNDIGPFVLLARRPLSHYLLRYIRLVTLSNEISGLFIYEEELMYYCCMYCVT